MPVLYKLRQDNRKNSANKGKWYARSLNIYTMKTEDVADLIQNNCTAKYSDVVAVLREFKEVLTNALADSKAVHVDGLGTFKVGLKTSAAATAADFNAAKNIVGMRINFQPEVRIDAKTKAHTVALLSKCHAAETPSNDIVKTPAVTPAP